MHSERVRSRIVKGNTIWTIEAPPRWESESWSPTSKSHSNHNPSIFSARLLLLNPDWERRSSDESAEALCRSAHIGFDRHRSRLFSVHQTIFCHSAVADPAQVS